MSIAVLLGLAGCLEPVLNFETALDRVKSQIDPPPEGETPPPVTPPVQNSCVSYSTNFPRRVWRLTELQYVNAVKTAFPSVTNIGNPLEGAYASGPFNNNANGLQLNLAVSEKLVNESAKIAKAAAPSIRQSNSCLNNTLTESCIDGLVNSLGLKLFRRPLSESETIHFSNFFKVSTTNFGTSALDMLIEAMLLSPNFLFRYEVGNSQTGELSQYERASLISFSAANTSPDQTLMNAAQNNQLSSVDQIRSQFIRMAKKSGNYETIVDLMRQYLSYEHVTGQVKDASLFPGFTSQVAESLVRETDALIVDIMSSGNGTFENLFSTDTVMVSPATSQIYQVDASGRTGMFSTTESSRAGLLTQPSFLASVSKPKRTSPVTIGRKIRSLFLCTTIKAPPPGVTELEDLPEEVQVLTQREQLAKHSKSSCFECHKYMDAIGLGFENFDASGAVRTHEAGLPVNDSGEINYTGTDLDQTFHGGAAGASVLAKSELVQACFLKKSYLHLAGQTDETNAECFVKKAMATVNDSDDLVEIFGAMFGTFLLERRFGTLSAVSSILPTRLALPGSGGTVTPPPPPPPPVTANPAPPTFVSAPSNNAVLARTTTSVTITWSGGTGIFLSRATEDGKTNPHLHYNDNNRTYSITLPVKAGSTYDFWIHSRNENFSYSNAESFGTNNSVRFSVAN